jgi:hypothetical protein
VPRSGAPLREREFRLLFTGRTISLVGSAIAPVALAFAVLDLTHPLGYAIAGPVADTIGVRASQTCGRSNARTP